MALLASWSHSGRCRIFFTEALALDLQVMGRVAIQKALEHGIRIHVFDAEDPELPTRVAKGEVVGTLLFP